MADEKGGLIRAGDLFENLELPEITPRTSRKSREPRSAKLTPIKLRLIKSDAALNQVESVLYQHSGLCQTCLPYRDPGDAVRVWERRNGSSMLRLEAGAANDGKRFVEVGLPYGPKPRIILAHLNTEALRTGSPEIDTASSLTAFVDRIGLATSGRNMQTIKDQLTRLAATTIRIGRMEGGSPKTTTGQIVGDFSVFQKDENNRVIWPKRVQLSRDYFESLQEHAVPLNEAAIAALSHSAMALDAYSWLAQRLHRIPAGKPILIPWTALYQQFGADYERIRAFRAAFKVALRQVHTQYSTARFDLASRGMLLWNSPTPVQTRTVALIG